MQKEREIAEVIREQRRGQKRKSREYTDIAWDCKGNIRRRCASLCRMPSISQTGEAGTMLAPTLF